MDVVPSFVADAEASKLVKPAVRAFDHPTIDSEAAAVLGVAFRQERFDAQVQQFLAVLFRIVRAISINAFGPAARRPTLPVTGGIASTTGNNWVTSAVLALVTVAARGIPFPSVAR